MRVECKGRRVVFRAEIERLPNGVEHLVDRVIFPNSVAVIPAYKDSREVELIEQYRPSVGKWLLEAPAGTLKEGEDPEEAAKRELAEEAGLYADELAEVGRGYVSPGYSTEFLKLYIAWNPKRGPANRERYEVITRTVRLKIDEAVKKVWSGEIEDVKTMFLILAVASKL